MVVWITQKSFIIICPICLPPPTGSNEWAGEASNWNMARWFILVKKLEKANDSVLCLWYIRTCLSVTFPSVYFSLSADVYLQYSNHCLHSITPDARWIYAALSQTNSCHLALPELLLLLITFLMSDRLRKLRLGFSQLQAVFWVVFNRAHCSTMFCNMTQVWMLVVLSRVRHSDYWPTQSPLLSFAASSTPSIPYWGIRSTDCRLSILCPEMSYTFSRTSESSSFSIYL